MKVAIVDSRTLSVADFSCYLPDTVTCIISGGAKGIDTAVKKFAASNCIPIIEYLPEYNLYGRSAPLKRNVLIVDNSDKVIVFWDGKSRGSKFVIDYCVEHNKNLQIYLHTCNGNYMPYSM